MTYNVAQNKKYTLQRVYFKTLFSFRMSGLALDCDANVSQSDETQFSLDSLSEADSKLNSLAG